MCFARPHPNEYTKSFDPSRWLELNPKFYKYMPAQSLRKIPAAGKAVPRSPGFSVAAIIRSLFFSELMLCTTRNCKSVTVVWLWLLSNKLGVTWGRDIRKKTLNERT